MAGLYIHIPYCVRKCLYCDFVSYPEPKNAGDIVPYLCREMELRAGELPTSEHIDTVFLGGGTPSLLSGDEVSRLLSAARECFSFAHDLEITVECNPGTVSPEKLRGYREAGVSRLSFGLQSAIDKELKAVGRIHSFAEFMASYSYAIEAGFANINIDVMHGLPGQTVQSYLLTLHRVTGLDAVTHISSYRLILEENTPLYRLVSAGKVVLPTEDETADMDDAGIAFLNGCGFNRYEISNFAKDGYRCRHNINYWENGVYLGIGPAAHGAIRNGNATIRYENTPDICAYKNNIDTGSLPESARTPVERNEQMFETVMLALRMTEGLSRHRFTELFGTEVTDVYPKSIAHAVANGWAELEINRLFLTQRGLDVQNAVLLSFMEEQPYT